jgi:hypothetical protein
MAAVVTVLFLDDRLVITAREQPLAVPAHKLILVTAGELVDAAAVQQDDLAGDEAADRLVAVDLNGADLAQETPWRNWSRAGPTAL